MAVQSYNKKANAVLCDYFSSTEFDCPCTTCTRTLIDEELITRLTAIRVQLAAPIRVNSGYRCAVYQAELKARGYETASGISQHQLGKAADIMSEPLTGLQLEEAARASGFKAVGVGACFVHVDLRDDKDRRWTYVRG